MKKIKKLNLIIVLEIAILLFMLLKFWQHDNRFSTLEASNFNAKQHSAPVQNITDTVTFLFSQSGDIQEPNSNDIFHRGNGQALWLLKSSRLTPQSPIFAMTRPFLNKESWENLKQETDDGFLNCLYDAGGPFDELKSNFFNALKPTLNSNLLPWQKRLGIIFLSGTSPQLMESLRPLLYEKPTLCVFYPQNTLKKDDAALKNFIPLPRGLTKLTDDLSCLVVPDETGANELELIFTFPTGCALISGEGRAGFFQLIKKAERLTGKPVKFYLGGTGLLNGTEDPILKKELLALKNTHPSLIIRSNYSTSLMAQEMLQEIFHNHYQAAQAGERITLNP